MTRWVLAAAVVLAAVVLPCAGALGQAPPDSAEIQQELDKCIASRPPSLTPPSLISDGKGGWRCVPNDGPGLSLGWLIPLFLLWAALPMVIAGMVASSRGESVGLAIVLTLTLGWVGFGIVMVGLKRSAREVQSLVGDVAGSNRSSADLEERLRALDDLRGRSVITDEEHAARRREIIAET